MLCDSCYHSLQVNSAIFLWSILPVQYSCRSSQVNCTTAAQLSLAHISPHWEQCLTEVNQELKLKTYIPRIIKIVTNKANKQQILRQQFDSDLLGETKCPYKNGLYNWFGEFTLARWSCSKDLRLPQSWSAHSVRQSVQKVEHNL